jgi:hypothetical protein
MRIWMLGPISRIMSLGTDIGDIDDAARSIRLEFLRHDNIDGKHNLAIRRLRLAEDLARSR